MKRPKFRTVVQRAPAMAMSDQLPTLRAQFEAHCPMRPTNAEPETVEVFTSFDLIWEEYCEDVPMANGYWSHNLGQQDRDMWRKRLVEIHAARCELARQNIAVREQAENLIRLTDKSNIDTLAETILDSIRIARADVKAFAKKWLVDREVEP